MRETLMKNVLNNRQLFDWIATPGEVFDTEWEDAIDEMIILEGHLLERCLSRAGVAEIYQIRGAYVAYDDDGAYGPFKTSAEAFEAIGRR